MEQVRDYASTITLHKHLAEMDLRFATGIRQKELRHDLDILNNTQVNGDFVEVYIPYSGSSPLFCDISTAEQVAWMLSEVASREKADREADIRIVMIEASPQPERFIRKVMNFISGGYYY